MLVAEGFEVGVTLVKEAVVEWKRRRREVFVPLVYPAGDLAQVDYFEVLLDLGGRRIKAWMFLMRWMHSGRDFAWLYTRQDQISFLDGHVRAFEHFGCVPQRIAYDNLKAAVSKMLVGSERQLAARFEALASHYLFEACFCRPRTGHDKGGVESRGKSIRWQHLVLRSDLESLVLGKGEHFLQELAGGASHAASLARVGRKYRVRRTGRKAGSRPRRAITRPAQSAPYTPPTRSPSR
jgi:hypothetical protein